MGEGRREENAGADAGQRVEKDACFDCGQGPLAKKGVKGSLLVKEPWQALSRQLTQSSQLWLGSMVPGQMLLALCVSKPS